MVSVCVPPASALLNSRVRLQPLSSGRNLPGVWSHAAGNAARPHQPPAPPPPLTRPQWGGNYAAGTQLLKGAFRNLASLFRMASDYFASPLGASNVINLAFGNDMIDRQALSPDPNNPGPTINRNFKNVYLPGYLVGTWAPGGRGGGGRGRGQRSQPGAPCVYQIHASPGPCRIGGATSSRHYMQQQCTVPAILPFKGALTSTAALPPTLPAGEERDYWLSHAFLGGGQTNMALTPGPVQAGAAIWVNPGLVVKVRAPASPLAAPLG